MSATIVLLLVIAAIAALIVASYNGLVQKRVACENGWAQIDVQLKRRHDLIPNLVNTVKGYATHEKDVFESVTKARAEASSIQLTPELINDEQAFQKFQAAQASMSSALSRLLAVAENYPQLKADTSFRDLQAQLEGTENRITVARN